MRWHMHQQSIMRASSAQLRRGPWGALSGRLYKIVVVAMLVGGPGAYAPLGVFAQEQNEQPGAIWGKLEYYTQDFAMIDGKRYEFGKLTVVDTYSLKPDKRGNARVLLDQQGKVAQLFFFGIDMPEIVKRYRR